MTKVLLVGCGKMGGAMLDGWLQSIAASDVVVVDPAGAAADMQAKGVAVVTGADAVPADFTPDVVVLAVKPQMMEAVVPAYKRFQDALFLSIAAGKTIAYFQKHLGDVAIIRAMPNTPAAVGAGITVCVANKQADKSAQALAEQLLSSVGEVAWLGDESLMDAVTAVSGSGPAYVFLLAEVMAEAGVRAGLPPELATRLARATVSGSGKLLAQSSASSAQLRINVTSPGGTTAAALGVLMQEDKGFGTLMDQAVLAATKRGKELAG